MFVTQLVVVDFTGIEPTPEVQQLIEGEGIGGIILFAKNIASPRQVARLTNTLQTIAAHASRPPLLISIDQEGGPVTRIGDPVTVFPSAMAIGATGSAAFAEQAGTVTARELRSMGVNVNHAPVLDVNTNPQNPVIGVRAFGDDPEVVAELGIAYLRGLQGQGVLATAKHFPGHGDTNVDSHVDLPSVTHDWMRLMETELLPFRLAIAAGCDGIMSAHIDVAAIDPSGVPATMSGLAIDGVLRGQLGFRGLVFTDSMRMQAIARYHSAGYATLAAVQAGADMILACGEIAQQREMITALRRAVERGTITSGRLKTSWARLTSMRQKYRILDHPVLVNEDTVEQVVGIPEHRATAQRIADAAVTVVRDEARLLPLPAGRVLVFDAGAESEVSGLGRRLKTLRMEIQDVSLDRLLAGVSFRDGVRIIAVTSISGITDPQQVTMIRQLAAKYRDRLIVVTGNPYVLAEFPEVGTFLTTYGPDAPSLTAAARILCGQLPPKGRLPVQLPGLHSRGHAVIYR